jgi:predicted nucleotidyltransferase component of viral defense system
MSEAAGGRTFPIRLSELNEWAARNRVTSDEARRRFVQFVVLDSLAAANVAKSLAFKGGNALRFGYGYPRSTFDLDFTATNLEEDSAAIRSIIDEAVREGSRDFEIKCKVSSVHRNPRSLDRTLPTYTVKVAYSFPGDRAFADFLESSKPSTTVVPVDISFNDIVCETVVVHFGGVTTTGIRICTLNDIVAEKLRAILQQVVRNRTRPQDVYDISRVVRLDRAKIDLSKVRSYVAEKCRARDIVFSERAFDESIRARAQYGYDELRGDLGDQFIPFEEAWEDVVSFARELLALD